MDLARDGGGQRYEKNGSVRHVPQIVGVRIVDLRHRVHGFDLGGGDRVYRRQIRDPLAQNPIGPIELGDMRWRGWTNHQDQRSHRGSG